ncbi:MAG: OmpA family protein [Acidobacteriia bacterium]|nr:OmpA family protein [Terriglobia bacterium]
MQRTAKAINYQYRSGPTKIDFRGTVLLPHAKGDATVEARRGRTEIGARLEGLTTPQRFGREYLTYVLWAITPEGRPHNIGELIADGSDKARVHVTTDLQAFALIVTAEPYSAVRQPSDVVVLENEVRPETLGIVEPVRAKYELLPRGEYTWRVPSDLGAPPVNSPKVSMHEYDAIVELYQARNAVGIAGNANAERYAADTFAQAKRLLAEAERLHDEKADYSRVVQSAREAAQTAEDARMIAQQRQQAERLKTADAELSEAQAKAASAQQVQERAAGQVQQAQAEADAARAQAQAALAARDQAEAEARAARERVAPSRPAASGIQDQRELTAARERDSRMRLLQDLKRVFPTLDTTRGLVATLPDDSFVGGVVRGASAGQVARMATILMRQPGLSVSVEGHSDSAARDTQARERADAVRHELVANGVPAGSVSATGLGDSRPLSSNATSQWRKENSRVEIVIAGDAIGKLPLWEQTYSLTRPEQHPSGR